MNTPTGSDWSDGTRLWKVGRDPLDRIVRLEEVDVATIRPLFDSDGRVPQLPNPAFVQFIDNKPWCWLSADDLISSGPGGIQVGHVALTHPTFAETRQMIREEIKAAIQEWNDVDMQLKMRKR